MNIFLRHGEVKNPKDILYYNIPGYDLSKLCLLYTSPSPRDAQLSRMPSSA